MVRPQPLIPAASCPWLGVLLFEENLVEVPRVGFDMAARAVGGAEIGPEVVNSTAYRGVNVVFVTSAP